MGVYTIYNNTIPKNTIIGVSIIFILVSNKFVWTGKWFKKVKVLEEKIKTRYLEFDDGWSYRHYWGPWKENYEFVKIIDKN